MVHRNVIMQSKCVTWSNLSESSASHLLQYRWIVGIMQLNHVSIARIIHAQYSGITFTEKISALLSSEPHQGSAERIFLTFIITDDSQYFLPFISNCADNGYMINIEATTNERFRTSMKSIHPIKPHSCRVTNTSALTSNNGDDHRQWWSLLLLRTTHMADKHNLSNEMKLNDSQATSKC